MKLLIVSALLTFFILCLSPASIHGDEVLQHFAEYFTDASIADLPKCCPPQLALQAYNTSFSCEPSLLNYSPLEIIAHRHLSGKSEEEDCQHFDCIDLLVSGTKPEVVRLHGCNALPITPRSFPKCCPSAYRYERSAHACVRRADNRNQDNFTRLQVIAASLDCPPKTHAIVDFAIARRADVIIDATALSLRLADEQVAAESGRYCIDDAEDGEEDGDGDKLVVRVCMKATHVCSDGRRRCIRKCCPINEIYVTHAIKSVCTPFYDVGFDMRRNERVHPRPNDSYGIIPAGSGLRYIADAKYNYHVDVDGTFEILEDHQNVRYDAIDANYCFEYWRKQDGGVPEMQGFLFIVPDKYTDIKFIVQAFLFCVSCVFLLATIVCYLLLPDLQNLHGKATLMFCLMLFTGFIMLTVVAFTTTTAMPQWLCTAIGFLIAFVFQGAFAWMNVMCFDMWMAFGTMRVLDVKNKKKELKKFLCYNLYAWGVPIIIIGTALIVFQTRCLPDALIPRIGNVRCYFDKDKGYDYLLFFCLPVAIMVGINCVLFAKTAIYCVRVKNEIERMRTVARVNDQERKSKRFAHDKEKFIMVVKLLLVMGIPWTFEVVSSILPFKQEPALQVFEAAVDLINSTTGIWIFCIFVLKRRVLNSLRMRLGFNAAPQRRPSEFSTVATVISGQNGNGLAAQSPSGGQD